MENKKTSFDASGLHIDKERVLLYSRLNCPFGCRYCFVDDLDQEQRKHVSYLSEEQYELIGQLPEEVTLIMLGCDTEFFQSKEDSMAVLKRLAKTGKDISIVTKYALPANSVSKINSIRLEMSSRGSLLAYSVSLPCFESALAWEPKSHSPEKRIESLKRLFNSGFKTLVAIRPLLPTITDAELNRVVSSTSDICHGYYPGPLYLKNLDKELIPPEIIKTLYAEKIQPHWMPEGNEFFKLEKPGQMEFLKSCVAEKGKKMFAGAAEAIQFLKEHEKH